MRNSSHSLIILCIAVIALCVMSLLPWDDWTGGKLKRFNLFADIFPPEEVLKESADHNIDPELLALAETGKDGVNTDSVSPEISEELPIVEITDDYKAPRIDGNVVIEDFSYGGHNLSKLKNLFDQAGERNIRIALVGDSYIEGDIFSQDVRAGLQTKYGGKGVGYIAAHSNFPGFRSSVNQSGSGWKEHEIKNMKNDSLRTILGLYHSAGRGATATFRKSSKPANLDSWDRTSIIFLANNSGTIEITSDNSEHTYDIEPSAKLQIITLDERTGNIKFKNDVEGLKVLGFWLENDKGITLDNISLRGNSGVSHRKLNVKTTRELRSFIDYDLIILEFGMNALSPEQKNYSAYGSAMVEVIENLKNLYPNSIILVMGVGDRGQKIGTTLASMPTVVPLIKAQREAALKTGSLFWDTREAMGGEGAAINWYERKLANSDYVHLNHKGGKELALLFLNSLNSSIK